ncbi:MAG: hypothetical protein KatS3mg110_4418 [Pirellulaceae bacterium]|nr:MAG: hypothetical protein KatS3mg110_4418 [Pirellulaceae bacterium]
MWQPGEVLWALGDHLGTVRDLIDSSGNVVNHLRYEAFGRITSETNAAVDFLFAFTGRERDEESGLFYYRARYYDPAVGRFISEDPLGFAAGDRNLARYVGNIPIVALDPSGLQSPQESPSIRVIRQPLDPTDRFPIRWRIGVDRPADRPIGVVQRMRFDYRILLPGGDLQQGTQDYFELIGIIVPPDDTVTIIGHPNITKSWYNQIAITDDYYNPDRARRLLDRTYRRYTTDFIFASQLPDQRYHDIYMYNPPAGSTGWVTFRGELRLYEANEPFMRIVQTWDDAPAVKSPLLRSGQLPAAHIDPSRRVAYEYRNFMDAFWNTPNAHLGRDVKTVRAEWDRDGQVTVEQ